MEVGIVDNLRSINYFHRMEATFIPLSVCLSDFPLD